MPAAPACVKVASNTGQCQGCQWYWTGLYQGCHWHNIGSPSIADGNEPCNHVAGTMADASGAAAASAAPALLCMLVNIRRKAHSPGILTLQASQPQPPQPAGGTAAHHNGAAWPGRATCCSGLQQTCPATGGAAAGPVGRNTLTKPNKHAQHTTSIWMGTLLALLTSSCQSTVCSPSFDDHQ